MSWAKWCRSQNGTWQWPCNGKDDLALRKDKDGWGIYNFMNYGDGEEPRLYGPFETEEAAKNMYLLVIRDHMPKKRP